MVFLGNISVGTLHKGDTKDDDDGGDLLELNFNPVAVCECYMNQTDKILKHTAFVGNKTECAACFMK
jgi:hypothetical protein